MTTFSELNIHSQLVETLAKQSITIPTSIQTLTIEPILANKDIIGEAVTGSGKTLAYVLPAFERIDVTSKEVHTLILAPSHELVLQIGDVIKQLANDSGYLIRSAAIIGSVNITRQIETLKSKPHIVVGTPGRILELINLKKLKAHFIKTIVIDEADKLLSKDHIQTIKDIIKTTQKQRQLLAFSASIKPGAVLAATELMKEPHVFKLSEEKINADIEHLYITSTRRDKTTTLRKLIHAAKPTKAIVFLNKNELIQEVNDVLIYHAIKSVCIFGNATKPERKKALDAFKSGSANVLVASDLVARGLDLQGLTHVFNLDIPIELSEYIHRVGRTGRAGEKGTAISIVTEKEVEFIKAIERINSVTMSFIKLHNGKLIKVASQPQPPSSK